MDPMDHSSDEESEISDSEINEYKNKYNGSAMSLRRMQEEKGMLFDAFVEESRRMQLMLRDYYRRIVEEQDNLNKELETKKRKLDSWRKELNKRETVTERERQKLGENKKKNDERSNSLQLASEEQKEADRRVKELVEQQNREKGDALHKILQLEKQLNTKQKVEMEIKELKGKLEVMKHLENQDDAAVKKKMQVMKEELEEKVEELESLETLNQALITKERRSNDEVQDARKALITGLSDKMTGESQIGIKRMGELESMTFLKVCKERFSPMEAEVEASTLYSLWQENLKNPEWHPFRAIGEEGHEQEIINKGDEKLQNLKKEWGDELHDCVVTALKELNEYNASGQYVVSKRRKESHIEGGNQLYHEEH